jgi:hypothetical protein
MVQTVSFQILPKSENGENISVVSITVSYIELFSPFSLFWKNLEAHSSHYFRLFRWGISQKIVKTVSFQIIFSKAV